VRQPSAAFVNRSELGKARKIQAAFDHMRSSLAKVLRLLRDYESRNVTYIDANGSWPIVWRKARGVHVWDAAGKKYLDLTAAFGVAAAGHANPTVVRAARRQMSELLHAMGDVHPHALKAELARELSRITFGRWTKGKQRAKTIFCNSGFEAVEAAIKTAMLATGKKEVIAFQGAYHGLGYGALTSTHREFFRKPFRTQLADFTSFAPFPCDERTISDPFTNKSIGAILVEPVQGRAGIRIPPPDFLPMLRKVCDQQGALLILDEIFTGFGRTGRWFACEHTETVPDLICLGKALTGGFPLSACVGKAEVMDTWPPSTGEAIHTSTFLGHPVGCAMALAQIEEIRSRELPARSAQLGKILLDQLSSIGPARGLGLMAGLDFPSGADALRVVKNMLERGYILLPEGEHGDVIAFTPPLTITERQIKATVKALADYASF
jgi:4-aminobutyrate aminotransferase-like enzyme